VALFSLNGWAASLFLTVGVTDTNQYGYAYDAVFSNQIVAEFEFSQTQDDLLLTLSAYDIDTTTEVDVRLNGNSIGYLPKSANNAHINATFTIAQAQQLPGLNQLRFVQSVAGWRWGVTNLKLDIDSTDNTNPALQLGVTNTERYGNKFYGTSNYPAIVNFDIPGSDQGLTLNLDSFDIDTPAEVTVSVNGQSIGNLATTSNNSIGSDSLTIAASLLSATDNVLSFKQNVPGWTWGVTNLVLTQNAPELLSIDVPNTNNYGYGFNGIYSNPDAATFEFVSQGVDLALSVDTFDIDTANEVTIELNGQTIGYLDKTGNNSNGETTVLIPASAQVNGTNTLVFSQLITGWTWGITNTLLTTNASTRLTLDVVHQQSYGYSYNGVNRNPELAQFVFTSTNRNLKLSLISYDIDTSDEIAIELNGSVIGFLTTTPNNSEGSTEFVIPAHLLIAGDNLLSFRQKNMNWRWGIKSILLQTQPEKLPAMNDYELVFADEFNAGSLDASKWNTGMLWGPYLTINSEQQLYVDSLGINQNFQHSPFSFSADTLTISATPTSPQLQPPARPAEDAPVWDNYVEYQYNGPNGNNPGYRPEDIDYLSGIITSYDSFKMTHGYVEARVKLPAGKGLWPAFWLLNTHYVEDAPEIDVMEFLGDGTDTIYHTYHYFDITDGWQKISTPSFETLGPNWTNSFHTFGLAWSPNQIVWYVDGVETRRITDNDYKIASQAMYLIANLAVGGNWPGAPDANTVFPAHYEIDYIRAYKRKLSPTLDLANDYQLMFNDEFNGTTLDSSKWNTAFLWGPYLSINNEEQYYVDSNDTDQDKSYSPFTVNNGVLTITAQRDVPPASLPGPNDQIWLDNPQFQRGPYPGAPAYTSGMITSYDAFKFVNGYAEIRAKVPDGDGLWPAFWLLNAYYVGTLPEIDIMEIVGENPQTAYHTFHRSNTNGMVISEVITITMLTNLCTSLQTLLWVATLTHCR